MYEAYNPQCSTCYDDGFTVDFDGTLSVCRRRKGCTAAIFLFFMPSNRWKVEHDAIFSQVNGFQINPRKQADKLMDVLFAARKAVYFGETDCFYKLFEEAKKVSCASTVKQFCDAVERIASIAQVLPRD